MLIYSLFQPKYALLLSLLMVVLVAVWTGRLRRRIELIKLQLLRIAKPAAYLFTRGENFHFQQDDDQLAGLDIHSAAHQLGDLDYRVLLHVVVAYQVIQIDG